ncbi:uncharacterized protein [Battus philenor]|uniref:uncharacterized protein n=1 Tax=Battus philenor TaxID=42288 RepID=UPI0035D0361A
MLRNFLLLPILITTCAAASTRPMPIRCGMIPSDVYTCMGTPKIVQPGVSIKCDKSVTQCDRITCLFRESGWLSGDKLDKKKLTEHFEQFKREFPEWSAAVDNLKESCINSELPPQGVYINCPAYDIMFCSLSSFIKLAPVNKWSSEASCTYARQYAAACPVCPNDCFAPLVPIGSCNSCSLLPRSP